MPDQSGENFIAHVTVGLAQLDFLADLESEPFDAFTFHPAGFAVFQLGTTEPRSASFRSGKAAREPAATINRDHA